VVLLSGGFRDTTSVIAREASCSPVYSKREALGRQRSAARGLHNPDWRRASMKARDVMTSDVVSVQADTPVREIARLLLENHVSGAPVLDHAGAAIGMVTEGDLIGREEPDRQARRDWWLGLLAEGEPLGAEFLSTLGPVRQRTASEVMSSPVLSVSEDTDAAEIARLLRTYRIKRAPVMRNGKVVGIVSREDLLRCLAEKEERHSVARPKSWLLPASITALFEHPSGHDAAAEGRPPPDAHDAPANVTDFRRLVTDFEEKEVQHRDEVRRGVADQHRRVVADLVGRHISDEAWRKLVHDARLAAERGENEFMLLRFPSELCSDGGRGVNAPEPDWPATLRGEAAEVFLRWEQDLKPQGFHIAARVVDFPGGMPGDIGLFLSWRR
jgi:CBS domain-containing protein